MRNTSRVLISKPDATTTTYSTIVQADIKVRRGPLTKIIFFTKAYKGSRARLLVGTGVATMKGGCNETSSRKFRWSDVSGTGEGVETPHSNSSAAASDTS